MARRAFFSFHYTPDCTRASQVRNIGALEGNAPVSDNDWESVTKGGDKAIEKWIDNQMAGKSVAIVLIGANTAGRKWIDYEITKAWNDGKGLVGVHVHNLKDLSGSQCSKGSNPFTTFKVGGVSLSSIVSTFDPPFTDSKKAYGYISDNLATWADDAVTIRSKY